MFAPLVLVAARIAGIGLEDPFADTANAGRFLAVELLSFAATLAFLPAALFLAWVLGGRQRLTGSIGAALVVLGVVGSVGIYALDFASVELARAGPPDEMRSIFVAMLANPGVQVLRSFELGLPIGLVVFAWAFWRGRVAPWYASLAVAVSVVLSNDTLPDGVAVVGSMLLLAGLGLVTIDVLRAVAMDARAVGGGNR